MARKEFAGGIAFGGGNPEKDVLRGDILVLQALRFFERALKNLIRFGAEILIGRPGNFWEALDLFLNFTSKLRRRDTQLFEQGRDDAVALRDQCPEEMEWLDLLLSEASAHFLRCLHRFLGFNCKFVESRHSWIFSLFIGDK